MAQSESSLGDTHYCRFGDYRTRVSSITLLILLTIALAILLPIGTVVQVESFLCGTCGAELQFMRTIELSMFQLNVLSSSFPGIVSVFILWILVASIHVLNLLFSSRGMVSPIISWFVFLPALVAQIYIPSLSLNLALPYPELVSQVSEPNVISSLPIILGLVSVSLRNRQKSNDKQWTRTGYG